MRRFAVYVALDNAAYVAEDGSAAMWEIAHNLREVTDRICRGDTEGPVVDLNGNTVGRFGIEDFEPETGDYYELCSACQEEHLSPDDHKCPNPDCLSHQEGD